MDWQITTGKSFDTEKRTIFLIGDIDDHSTQTVFQALTQMDPTKGLEIILSSGGGNEAAGYSIYDRLMGWPGHVTVNAYGQCMSIAMVLLQAADYRVLQPNCDLMVHGGSVELTGQGSIQQAEIVSMAQSFIKGNERYINIIQQRCGQPLALVEKWCGAETYFGAEEAIELGLADAIAPPAKVFTPRKGPKKRRPKGT